MILVIDNYDSFVHTLARYLREAGGETVVVRNDEASVHELLSQKPSAVVLSPGPHAPAQAGVSLALIRALEPQTPLLGVCLGHQCLVEAFGGTTVRAANPLHGEASLIRHDGGGLFAGLASPFAVGRYHSLISVLAPSGPLLANAWSEEGELMAVRHVSRPWFGVQFHPESLLTPVGRPIIGAFMNHVAARRAA